MAVRTVWPARCSRDFMRSASSRSSSTTRTRMRRASTIVREPVVADQAHGGHVLLEVDVLADVAVRAEPVARVDVALLAGRRQDDDRDRARDRVRLQALQHLEAAD